MTAPPVTSGPTGVDGGEGTGRRGGVTAPSPVTSGRTRHQVMVAVVAGKSQRAMARELGLTQKTVWAHVNALLLAGIVQRTGGGIRPGPGWAVAVAGFGVTGADRYPPGPATAGGVAVVTDGKRTFTVLREPSQFHMDWPGYVRTSVSGRGRLEVKRRNHLVKWTREGRTHELLVTHQPTTEAWGLQYVRCIPPPTIKSLGEGDTEALWDRFVAEHVLAWGKLAGVLVDQEPRRSRPVSQAFPGVLPAGMKWRGTDSDGDDTPEPRTLEVRRDEIRAFVEGGHAVQAAQADALAELEGRLSRTESRAQRLTVAFGKVLALTEGQQDREAALLAAMVPRRADQPRQDLGVEYA